MGFTGGLIFFIIPFACKLMYFLPSNTIFFFFCPFHSYTFLRSTFVQQWKWSWVLCYFLFHNISIGIIEDSPVFFSIPWWIQKYAYSKLVLINLEFWHATSTQKKLRVLKRKSSFYMFLWNLVKTHFFFFSLKLYLLSMAMETLIAEFGTLLVVRF